MSITEATTYELTPALRTQRAWAACELFRRQVRGSDGQWMSPEMMSLCARLYSEGGHMRLGLRMIHLGHELNQKSLIGQYREVMASLWSYYPEIFPTVGDERGSDHYDPVAHPEHDDGIGAGLLRLLKVT